MKFYYYVSYMRVQKNWISGDNFSVETAEISSDQILSTLEHVKLLYEKLNEHLGQRDGKESIILAFCLLRIEEDAQVPSQ